MKIERVAVFCASSPEIDGKYFEASESLGRILADNNIAVNYGGGGRGLMGAVANAVLARKGSVRGYIPVFMKEMEWAHPDVDDMVLVRDMHERKYLLSKDVDAVIALPGGVGTMDELMEIITLKQLGKFIKPIIIVNTDNYYGPLLELLSRMVEERFMRVIHQNIWSVVEEPEQVIEAIRTSPVWDASAIKIAAVEKHEEDL